MMKSTLLEVLMDLFHHYLEEKTAHLPDLEDVLNDLQSLSQHIELLHSDPNNDKTQPLEFDALGHISAGKQQAMRVFTSYEARKLSQECRGFLLLLEQSRLISASLREQIIANALEENGPCVELSDLKPIILNVMMDNIDDDIELAWVHYVLRNQDQYATKH